MSGEKTEEPTAKKLRDAREEGQVAKSKDFTHLLLVMALFGYLLVNAPRIVDAFSALILVPLPMIGMEFHAAANGVATVLLTEGVWILLPFVLLVFVVGIFAETLQTGIVFAFKALKPSGKKLNVGANLKNMVSSKNIVEFLKSVVKVIFLSALLYVLLKDALPGLMTLPRAGVAGVGMAVGTLLKLLIVNISIAFAFIAFADLVWQRHKHRKDLMMSKHEVEQEYKQMEGNQEIKHQRKHLHQEMMASGSVDRARKASVLVTNPTHLAIAVYYKKDETALPIVLAKGSGALAEQMMDAAREAGVPIVQDIPLAHALMNQAEVDQYIPSDLIEPIAEVLRVLQQLADEQDE
jgi:type III secretion protein U